MSCITKLLEMKGDKEFLPIHKQAVIEGGGVFKGFEYLITLTSHGTRCGYVAIPAGVRVNSDDLWVHGGITFEGEDHGAKDLLPIACSDTWLGFDCAHAGDGHDIELIKRVFPWMDKLSIDFYKRINECAGVMKRSYHFVEIHCHSLINQLLEMGIAA